MTVVPCSPVTCTAADERSTVCAPATTVALLSCCPTTPSRGKDGVGAERRPARLRAVEQKPVAARRTVPQPINARLHGQEQIMQDYQPPARVSGLSVDLHLNTPAHS